MLLDILIPTFNRSLDLEKNLNLLIKQINLFNLSNFICLSISNNFSSDNTHDLLEEIKSKSNIKINIYHQDNNIGLEKNAVFLLDKSQADFIMYLGDDDYIPDSYLEYIIRMSNTVANLKCIIPGFSTLYTNSDIRPYRNAIFLEQTYSASFSTVMKISQFGHQLSGIVLKRNNLHDTYIQNQELRNIYPFIYFVAYNNLHGISIYAPKYQVLVSQNNSKDWSYDDSGLLTEIFKNYKILFKNSYVKRNIMNFVFMDQQSWRLRIGKNPINAYLSFIHLEKDKNIDLLTKVILPFQYIYLFIRNSLHKIKSIYL